jgi:hypothetical protein
VRVFLYGVAERDLWTLVMVALVLIMSSSLAAFFPARRAAQVSLIEALRAERRLLFDSGRVTRCPS